MSARVADITAEFSFAYMKEAFVAALLVIVAQTDEKPRFRHQEDNLTDNILWKELKKQIDSLRKEMEGEDDDQSLGMSGLWPTLNSAFDERSERGTARYPQPGIETSQFQEPALRRHPPSQFGIERNTRPMDINRAMPRYF